MNLVLQPSQQAAEAPGPPVCSYTAQLSSGEWGSGAGLLPQVGLSPWMRELDLGSQEDTGAADRAAAQQWCLVQALLRPQP